MAKRTRFRKSPVLEGAPQAIAFKLDQVSDGVTSSGLWKHAEIFTSTDANKVYVYVTEFASLSQATEEAETEAKSASKVLEMSERYLSDGSYLGERFVVSFPKEVGSSAHSISSVSSRFLRDRPVLFRISSDSLNDVLAMEKYLGVY